MAQTVFDRYLEAEVLSADRVKLVWLLYRGAIDAVRSAVRFVEEGDIRARARSINRALGIVEELASSLNHAEGGEISRNLARLYGYMQNRLIEANIRQAKEPLEEVEALLLNLIEAWAAFKELAGTTEPGAAGRGQVAVPLQGRTGPVPANAPAAGHALSRVLEDAGPEAGYEPAALAVG
jgi:flagellar secretion chaperone FliS